MHRGSVAESETGPRSGGLLATDWSRESCSRDARRSACARIFYGLALAVVGAFVVMAATHNGGTLAGQLCYYGAEFAAAAGALARGLLRRDERKAWLLLAAGVIVFAVGDVYFQVEYGSSGAPPVSFADAFYLSFYPLVFASVISLMRARVRATTSATVWLDGIISALAVGALCAFATFGEVVSVTGSSPLTVGVNLAYPVADLMLGCLVVAIIGMHGWRLDATWLWLLAGLLIFAVDDSA